MGNIAKWVEEAANGEPIEAVTIGDHANDRWLTDKDHAPAQGPIPWAEGRPLLDYEFDNGFGGAECHPIWAWTASRVIVVSEYDGATGISWFPRHPSPGEPDFA